MNVMRVAALGLVLSVSQPVLAQEIKGEVIHQWTSAAESAGVQELARKFEELGGTWVDNAISGGPAARSTAVNRVLGGNPPAAMLFNTGAQFIELQQNGLLRDLNDIAEANDWANLMPRALLDASTVDGHVWALPISGNGANWFWFNKAVLDKLGATEPTNWDETFAVLDKAKEAGIVPFAAAGEPRWERLLYNAVVLGVAGRDVYVDVIYNQNADAVRSEAYRKAVDVFSRLRGYVDAGSPGRSWPDSANLVISGSALMTQGGTWLNGAFLSAGLEPGVDYECAIIGADQGMVISGDVFLFPNDEGQKPAQDLLIQAFSDPATQTAFAKANGTIPILKGADASDLNSCIAEASGYFANPELSAGGDQMIFSPAVVGAVEDAITRFWNNGGLDEDQFIEAYANGLAAQ
ncbi:ABC transporter substrate-binding protein [Devosia sp. LjRoot3]|uniref:ABC transporter substrate-binding protein n=1 Tax=Devosia sp. LjRoot3 TaxID=3342319 RepID=UPI003ED08208